MAAAIRYTGLTVAAGGIGVNFRITHLAFPMRPLIATQIGKTRVLSRPLELTEEIADELFEAGCDDGTPGTCNGVFSIDFHREAVSLEEAIRSAIEDVRTAGYEVTRVEIEA